jgi:hypothetical protein
MHPSLKGRIPFSRKREEARKSTIRHYAGRPRLDQDADKRRRRAFPPQRAALPALMPML